MARAQGSRAGCSTCTNTSEAALRKGYRATVRGTISGSESGSPQLLSVTSIDQLGCPGGNTVPPSGYNCENGNFRHFAIGHGSLMILSWGLMLPSGVIIARFLRHRPNALWFRIHKALQPMGLVIAIVGWCLALYRFDVFVGSGTALIHGSLGMVTMILGIQQPLNAIFRPHKQDGPVSTARWAWEILHKGSGYTAVFLGLVTIALGSLLASSIKLPGLGIAFAVVFVGLVLFVVWVVRDQKKIGSVLSIQAPQVQVTKLSQS